MANRHGGRPRSGAHKFWRGGAVERYGEETRDAIAALGADVPKERLLPIWHEAEAASWGHAPVWIHDDLATTNLLVDDDGRLAAVIDFGCSGVGDPACDLVLAWTYLDQRERRAFRESLPH